MQKVIAVPPDLLGKKVRCKGCSKVLKHKNRLPPKKQQSRQKRQSLEKQTKKLQPGDDPDDDGKAYGMHDMILAARCPNCAKELASEDAVLCIFVVTTI